MDNYINLAELRKTAEAILVKMQDKLDEKISTDDFILNGEYDSDHNYKIELTNDKSFTIPYSWVDNIASEVAQDEINDALSDIASFEVSVVSTLPTTGDSNTFYFLSKTGTTGDVYDEYMYINDQWEKIGTTAIDLNGYLKTTDIADWAKASTKPSYTASEVGALPIDQDKVFIATYNQTTYSDTKTAYDAGKLIFGVWSDTACGKLILPLTRFASGAFFQFESKYLGGRSEGRTLYLKPTGWTSESYYGDKVYRSATIESGDTFIIKDSNDSGVMKYTTLTFGTSTSQYLANDGTWQSVPTTLPASDVSDWAKAATKPTYTASEVGAVAKTGDTMSGKLILDYNNVNNNCGLRLNYSDGTYVDIYNMGRKGTTSSYKTMLKLQSGTSGNTVILKGIEEPDDNTDAANKKYVDDKFAAVSYPVTSVNTKTGAVTLSASDVGAMSTSHAANAITATDISNWNAKVSDTKTWGDAAPPSSRFDTDASQYIPQFSATSTASNTKTSFVVTQSTPFSFGIPKWDKDEFLYSTTPAATDNSKKVATTAYVKTAISNISIPPAQVQSDWNATSGMGVILNKPAYMTATELDTMLDEIFPTSR